MLRLGVVALPTTTQTLATRSENCVEWHRIHFQRFPSAYPVFLSFSLCSPLASNSLPSSSSAHSSLYFPPPRHDATRSQRNTNLSNYCAQRPSGLRLLDSYYARLRVPFAVLSRSFATSPRRRRVPRDGGPLRISRN